MEREVWEGRFMDQIELLLSRYPALSPVAENLRKASKTLCAAVKSGGKVLACGNGGSASDAEHIVGELMKEFRLKRPIGEELRQRLRDVDHSPQDLIDGLRGAIPAISLNSQTALMTALCNDGDPNMVFAQQVLGYGRRGDVLIALSTSGNSSNVLNAVRTARAIEVSTILIAGGTGGKIAPVADVSICLGETETYKVQELTLPLYHALCLTLEEEMFG